MPVNLNTRQPGSLFINVEDPGEVQYWSAKYDVTEDELRQAVRLVGPMALKVRIFLGK